MNGVDQAVDDSARKIVARVGIAAFGALDQAVAHVHQVGDHHAGGLDLKGHARLGAVARHRRFDGVKIEQLGASGNAESGFDLCFGEPRLGTGFN